MIIRPKRLTPGYFRLLQMQLAAGRGAEPGGRLLTPLALLLAAAGLCLSFYSARRMADPSKAPPERQSIGCDGEHSSHVLAPEQAAEALAKALQHTRIQPQDRRPNGQTRRWSWVLRPFSFAPPVRGTQRAAPLVATCSPPPSTCSGTPPEQELNPALSTISDTKGGLGPATMGSGG